MADRRTVSNTDARQYARRNAGGYPMVFDFPGPVWSVVSEAQRTRSASAISTVGVTATTPPTFVSGGVFSVLTNGSVVFTITLPIGAYSIDQEFSLSLLRTDRVQVWAQTPGGCWGAVVEVFTS